MFYCFKQRVWGGSSEVFTLFIASVFVVMEDEIKSLILLYPISVVAAGSRMLKPLLILLQFAFVVYPFYHLTCLQISLHSLNISNSLKIHPHLDTVYVDVLVCLFVEAAKEVKQLSGLKKCAGRFCS